MKRLWNVIMVVMVLVMVGACTTPEEDNSPLPTQPFQPVEDVVLPTQDNVPSTPDVPSPTPGVVATATPRGLPPTWTPTPTETLAPTLDVGGTWMASTPAPAATINPGCLTFNLDPSRTTTTFVVGDIPTLAWTTAQGASLYRVLIYDERGLNILHEELVQTTTVTINPDVFTVPGVYVWTVAPLDPFGIQMCTELGDGVVAERRRSS